MVVAGTASTDKVPAKVLNAIIVRVLGDAKNRKNKGGRKEVE